MAFIPYVTDSGQFTGSITVADTGTSTATGSNASSIYTGTPTTNSFVSINALNYNSFSLQVSGTWVGTLQVENSYDGGVTWYRVVPQVRGVSNSASTITSNGGFISEAAVASNVRVRSTAWTSGTASILFMQSTSSEIVRVDNPIRLYDNNSSQQASIKPASTAPVATDTSLVTVENPNSPIFTSTIKTKLANDIAATTGSITTATTTITTGLLTGVGSLTLQISGTYAGIAITFEASTDNTNWVQMPVYNVSSTTSGPITSAGLANNSTNVYNASPILGVNYFRVRTTTFTSGSASVSIQPSAQFVPSVVSVVSTPTTTVTGTVATTQSTSPWITREGGAATATITQVTPATASTVIKASNAARKRLIVYNGGTSDCYIAYGATASVTTFTFILPSLGTTTINGEEYTGTVNGIWPATGGSSMQVTECV